MLHIVFILYCIFVLIYTVFILPAIEFVLLLFYLVGLSVRLPTSHKEFPGDGLPAAKHTQARFIAYLNFCLKLLKKKKLFSLSVFQNVVHDEKIRDL